jgi:nitroreductase
MNMGSFDRSKLLGSFVSKDQPSVIDDKNIKNGFYDAPTVVCIFAPKDFLFSIPDAFCCAENIVLQATELGISSCIISRAEQTFVDDYGKELLKSWNIPDTYIARCFVILGYIDGEQPKAKPRLDGRTLIVE